MRASTVGTVTDQSGGVLPGVTVTCKHIATGRTFEFITSARGVYTASLLPVGDRWRGQLDVWVVQLGKNDAHLGTVTRVAALDLEAIVGKMDVIERDASRRVPGQDVPPFRWWIHDLRLYR